MGKLISNILVESKILESLVLSKKLEVEIGISLDARNLKNMTLIKEVIVLPDALDMNYVI